MPIDEWETHEQKRNIFGLRLESASCILKLDVQIAGGTHADWDRGIGAEVLEPGGSPEEMVWKRDSRLPDLGGLKSRWEGTYPCFPATCQDPTATVPGHGCTTSS